MNHPLVSIITPCFNGESYLNRYFESILNQTYPNIELIFVNDGSTDRTEEIALSYRSKLEERGISYIYLYQENAGQAAALNKGLKIFKGDYLTWPDSDDVMTNDCIEKKVAFLEKNPEYKLCVCKTKIVNEKDSKNVIGIYERKMPEGEDTFFEDIIYIKNVYFTPGGYMVDSKSLLKVLPERDIYSGPGGQNAQILLPMTYYYKCGYLDDYLNYYYVREESHSHSINNSKKTIIQLENYQKILLNTLEKIGLDVLEKYQNDINSHYARLKFGNAIDSEDKKLILQEFNELRKLKYANIKDRLLFIKKYYLN